MHKSKFKFGDTVVFTKTGERFFMPTGKRGYRHSTKTYFCEGITYLENELETCRKVITEKVSDRMFGRRSV